jgi:hypothetical protein
VFFLDIDNFKTLNDSMGHSYGDRVLVAIARRLEALARDRGFAARLGGDEFTVVQHGAIDLDGIVAFGNSIVFDISVTNRSGGTQVLTLPTSQVYDLAVFTEGAQTPSWRWSFNRTFTPAATNLSFAAHQSISYLFIWDGVLEDGTQIMPGTYEVRGTLAYPQYASDWRGNDELASPIRKITITD